MHLVDISVPILLFVLFELNFKIRCTHVIESHVIIV